MRILRLVSFLGLCSLAASAQVEPGAAVAPTDARLFELRTTTAVEGKFQPLLARFRDHAMPLFEKHGMTNIAYWVPADAPEGRLVYLLAHRDRATRDASWAAFLADPEWQAVVHQTDAAGELISAVEEQFLLPAAFSPRFAPAAGGAAPRLFEMRTFIAMPGHLPALQARFQGAALPLFAKYGLTHLGTYQLAPGQAGAEQTLVAFFAHADAASATTAWDAFRSDPEWQAAVHASEAASGGPLTVVDGEKSALFLPTAFSPTR